MGKHLDKVYCRCHCWIHGCLVHLLTSCGLYRSFNINRCIPRILWHSAYALGERKLLVVFHYNPSYLQPERLRLEIVSRYSIWDQSRGNPKSGYSLKRMYRPLPYHFVQEIQKFNLPDYRPRMDRFRQAVNKVRRIQRLKRNRGYAFSQNDSDQNKIIRAYDTTMQKPRG